MKKLLSINGKIVVLNGKFFSLDIHTDTDTNNCFWQFKINQFDSKQFKVCEK